MKYCPHCGAVLPDGAFSFCPACGKALPEANTMAKEKKAKQKKTKRKKPKPAKSTPTQPEDGYDGYYDDRLPIDAGKRREGIDTGIIKKIVAVVVCLLVVIGACVALLYVL